MVTLCGRGVFDGVSIGGQPCHCLPGQRGLIALPSFGVSLFMPTSFDLKRNDQIWRSKAYGWDACLRGSSSRFISDSCIELGFLHYTTDPRWYHCRKYFLSGDKNIFCSGTSGDPYYTDHTDRQIRPAVRTWWTFGRSKTRIHSNGFVITGSGWITILIKVWFVA